MDKLDLERLPLWVFAKLAKRTVKVLLTPDSFESLENGADIVLAAVMWQLCVARAPILKLFPRRQDQLILLLQLAFKFPYLLLQLLHLSRLLTVPILLSHILDTAGPLSEL